MSCATALECCASRLGRPAIVIGVAEAGKEISDAPVPARHRAQLCEGYRVWWCARADRDVPKIVDWYMDGKIEIDPMITHRLLSLDEINTGFDLMHAGESIRSVVIY